MGQLNMNYILKDVKYKQIRIKIAPNYQFLNPFMSFPDKNKHPRACFYDLTWIIDSNGPFY